MIQELAPIKMQKFKDILQDPRKPKTDFDKNCSQYETWFYQILGIQKLRTTPPLFRAYEQVCHIFWA